MTLSWNEIEDLMQDEMKILMMNEFKEQKYVPNVHCVLMVSKNLLSTFFVNLNFFLVILPQGFGYILLNNDMVRCKMQLCTLCVFDTEKKTDIGL